MPPISYQVLCIVRPTTFLFAGRCNKYSVGIVDMFVPLNIRWPNKAPQQFVYIYIPFYLGLYIFCILYSQWCATQYIKPKTKTKPHHIRLTQLYCKLSADFHLFEIGKRFSIPLKHWINQMHVFNLDRLQRICWGFFRSNKNRKYWLNKMSNILHNV